MANGRASFAERWGIPVHSSLVQMLGARRHRCGHGLHRRAAFTPQHTIEIAESGRHVLCEKPLDTRTDKAAEAALDDGAAAGRDAWAVSFSSGSHEGPMKVEARDRAGVLRQDRLCPLRDALVPKPGLLRFRRLARHLGAGWRRPVESGPAHVGPADVAQRLRCRRGAERNLRNARKRNIEAETLAVATDPSGEWCAGDDHRHDARLRRTCHSAF